MLFKDLGLHSPFRIFDAPGPAQNADDTQKNEISALTVSRRMWWWCDRVSVAGRWERRQRLFPEVPEVLRSSPLLTTCDMEAGEGRKFHLEPVVLLAASWPLPLEIWQATPQPSASPGFCQDSCNHTHSWPAPNPAKGKGNVDSRITLWELFKEIYIQLRLRGKLVMTEDASLLFFSLVWQAQYS